MKHPEFDYHQKVGRPKLDQIDDIRDTYAGPASYLYIEQKRSVGRPKKKKETRGRPKKIVKLE